MGIEFGNEPYIEPAKTKQTAEQMDKLLKSARMPEHFMTNYEFDERSRDVIIFRQPQLRDIQMYDICKFIDGTYGLVIMMQSMPAYNIRTNVYQYSYWSKNNGNSITTIVPTEFDGIDSSSKIFETPSAVNQLVVIQVYKDPRSLAELITACNSTTVKYKITWQSYRVCEVCEIHKNLYRNPEYANEVLASMQLQSMQENQVTK